MTYPARPQYVNWEMTYACQLRCTHCYTESGRRPSQALPPSELLRLTQRLAAMQLERVALAGGEPLLVPVFFAVVERLRAAGVGVSLYTNGHLLTTERAARLAELGVRVHVSLDGASPATHDAIRGRPGSFAAVLAGLGVLNQEAAARRTRGEAPLCFGADVTLVRRSFADCMALVHEIAPKFPEISFVSLAAAIPSGLASRAEYVERELVTEEQLTQLRDPGFQQVLQAKAPCAVSVSDGFFLQMRPDQIDQSPLNGLVELEPDGGVRGLIPYEGVVGNWLHDDPEAVWERVQARRRHPEVQRWLSNVPTLAAWGEAARRIDLRFASPERHAQLLKLHGARLVRTPIDA